MIEYEIINDITGLMLDSFSSMEKIKKMEKEKKYSGYGYHGGGRKATGVKRVSICISGQPEQMQKLKDMAKNNNMNVSQFIFYAVDSLELAEGLRKELIEKNKKLDQ